jgi:hypothetical protein
MDAAPAANFKKGVSCRPTITTTTGAPPTPRPSLPCSCSHIVTLRMAWSCCGRGSCAWCPHGPCPQVRRHPEGFCRPACGLDSPPPHASRTHEFKMCVFVFLCFCLCRVACGGVGWRCWALATGSEAWGALVRLLNLPSSQSVLQEALPALRLALALYATEGEDATPRNTVSYVPLCCRWLLLTRSLD